MWGALSGCGVPADDVKVTNNCGQGTFALGGECVALPGEAPAECGEDVVSEDGVCVPARPPVTCGARTREASGTCVPHRVDRPVRDTPDDGPACSVGTQQIDNVCVPIEAAEVSCGEGTEERDGVCASLDVRCGQGTHVEAGACVPDGVGAQCGEGTEERDGLCVTEGSVDCGEGTFEAEQQCRLRTAPVTCGAGVHAEAGACIADGIGLQCAEEVERDGALCVAGDDNAPCAEDTHVQDLECRPDGRALAPGTFSLSSDLQAAFADGYSFLKLAALGRDLQGLPATDTVIVRANRPGAGSFQVAEAPLSHLGRPFWFRPCSYATGADCAGPVTFELARADAPEVVLARTAQVELIVPEDIPWFEQCERQGDVLWMHGARDHGIMDGERLVTGADADFFGFSTGEERYSDRVGVYVDAGDWSWNIWFDTAQLEGPPMAQVYPRVEGPDPSTNTPGLMLDSPRDHCQITDAEVQIHDVVQTRGQFDNRTDRLALSFVADCVFPAYGRVVGCVKFGGGAAGGQP